jgi:hypothetical protein
MSALQDTIVSYLTEPYIYGRAVNPVLLLDTLHRKHPETPLSELDSAIRRVAAGIGVDMKVA